MTKKYCSIDLEFTGFDPEKEQILEIGFAFFEAGKNGFEVTETWSQVFKPTIEVHPKILGLTGITQAEIDSAPSIADHRDFLSENKNLISKIGLCATKTTSLNFSERKSL